MPTDDSAIALLLLFGFLAPSCTGSLPITRGGARSVLGTGPFGPYHPFQSRSMMSFPFSPWHSLRVSAGSGRRYDQKMATLQGGPFYSSISMAAERAQPRRPSMRLHFPFGPCGSTVSVRHSHEKIRMSNSAETSTREPCR